MSLNDFNLFFHSKNFEQSRRFSNNYTVAPLRNYLKKIDNPQYQYDTIHIAGSTGKSTLAIYLDRMLSANGLRVGRYTSPHLESFFERISVQAKAITEGQFNRLWQALKADNDVNKLSFFDALTAIAFSHFREEKCDSAIIETGLGGLKDSTNNLKAAVRCITPISLEHTNILGATLPEIAAEKAGIIHTNDRVISANQPAEVQDVLLKRAKQKNALIEFLPAMDHLPGHLRSVEFASYVFQYLYEYKPPKISYSIPGRMENLKSRSGAHLLFDSAHCLEAIYDLMVFLRKEIQQSGQALKLYVNFFQERSAAQVIADFKEIYAGMDAELAFINLTDKRFWQPDQLAHLNWYTLKEIVESADSKSLYVLTGSTYFYSDFKRIMST